MDLIFRKEEQYDYPEVRKLLKKAFKMDAESILVDNLRENPEYIPELSFVAEECDEKIVGYLLFFPIKIISLHGSNNSLALAPVATHPKYQRKGVGTALIERGLKEARLSGFDSVIVLGHPDFYPRFGFRPASLYGIKAPFDVPDAAFMALELTLVGLDETSGTVVYPDEFNDV